MDYDLNDAPEVPSPLDRDAGLDRLDLSWPRACAGEGHGYDGKPPNVYESCSTAAFNRLAGFDLDWSVGGNLHASSPESRVAIAVVSEPCEEQMRFFPASLDTELYEVIIDRSPRSTCPGTTRAQPGKSSYTFGKLARLAGSAILAHSQTPLKIAAFLGLVMAGLSLLAAYGSSSWRSAGASRSPAGPA